MQTCVIAQFIIMFINCYKVKECIFYYNKYFMMQMVSVHYLNNSPDLNVIINLFFLNHK